MPHASLKLKPGVNTTETPALNEAGISASNLIRYVFDPVFGALVQKLGGFTRYFPNPIVSVVRALWAWQDTEAAAHLAVGTENQSGRFQAQLSVITDESQINITPRSISDNVTPAADVTAGDPVVEITDATTQNITQYDSVYIPTHIAIGGIILFGLYATIPKTATKYEFIALDTLGQPLPAVTSSSAPVVAEFTTVSGSAVVTVTLPAHGYAAGSTYPVLVSTTVGGIAFFGNYVVQSVVDVDNFVINGQTEASSSTSGFINGGKVRFVYSIGIGAVPGGTGYGIGGYGRGGYGSGTAVIPATGVAIAADDWTLDNWGEILLACPDQSTVVLTTTGTSGNGTTGTVAFSEFYEAAIGEDILISGVSPATWNGSYTVTASTSGSVSFLSAVTSAQTVSGTVTIRAPEFQPIYEWNPQGGAPIATVIPQAPPVNDVIFVAMPQRQIIACGSTFTGIRDPLLIRWCDVNNFNVWIGQTINQAGSYRLTRGSRIVGAMQAAQQGYVWTDLDVWSMQYIGPPYVYSFNVIGTGCGLIGRKAAGSIQGTIFWMGPSQFFRLDDNGVVPVPCPVWDAVFQNMDTSDPNRIRAAVNSRFNEIAWYYPSEGGGGEIDSYVKYNVMLNAWDYGLLGRSAWIDQSVLGPPIAADPSTRYLQQHETSPDADGQPLLASFRTGYFAINDGDMLSFVDQWWPDMKFGEFGGMANATVNFTFYATDYPGQTPVAFGPYPLTQSSTYISTRIRTRLLAIQIDSSDIGSFWRIGNNRYRFAPDGRF